LDCVGLNKARSRSADLVRWVAAVTAAEIAREEPLDRAYVGNSIRSAIQSVSFVREQEILRVMIARAQRSDEAIGLIAPHTDVIGALHDQ
jgi:hypothetical protein